MSYTYIIRALTALRHDNRLSSEAGNTMFNSSIFNIINNGCIFVNSGIQNEEGVDLFEQLLSESYYSKQSFYKHLSSLLEVSSVLRSLKCNKEILREDWVYVLSYRHIVNQLVLLSFTTLALLALETWLSCPAWEMVALSSPFLVLSSLVPFFGVRLLLAAHSLPLSSPCADGLLFRFSSLPFFTPAAALLCCLPPRWDSPLFWKTEATGVQYEETFKIQSTANLSYTAVSKFMNLLKKKAQTWGMMVYLQCTISTEPFTIGYSAHLGFMAVSVVAFITTITE